MMWTWSHGRLWHGRDNNANSHVLSTWPTYSATMLLNPSQLSYNVELFVPILQMSKLILRKVWTQSKQPSIMDWQNTLRAICANTVPYRKLLKNEKMLYVLRHATVSKDNPSFRGGKKAKCRVMCVQCVKGRDYICCSNISKLAHSGKCTKRP